MSIKRQDLPRIIFAIFGTILIIIGSTHILPVHVLAESTKYLVGVMVLICCGLIAWLLLHVYFWVTEDGNRHEYVELDLDENPIPKHMLDMAQEIENLGLTQLGVLAIGKTKDPYRAWLWRDDTQTVIAYLVEHVNQKSFVQFLTTFVDYFQLEVVWNFDLEVSDSAVAIIKVENSINEAYHVHVKQQHAYERQHGKCKQFDSVASTFPEPEYHKHAMRQTFASQMKKAVINLLLWGTAILSLLVIIQYAPIIEPVGLVSVLILSSSLVLAMKSQLLGKHVVRKSHL